MRTPIIGERWKWHNDFIGEIIRIDNFHFTTIIVQVMKNFSTWKLGAPQGDSLKSICDWTLLEGQEKEK